MVKFKVVIQGDNVERVNDLLKENLNSFYEFKSECVNILMSEKYFIRNNSSLLTNIIINKINRNKIVIEIVSGGGSGGVTDWGAEKDRNIGIHDYIKEISEENSWIFTSNINN